MLDKSARTDRPGTQRGARPDNGPEDRPEKQRTRIGRPFQKGNPGKPKGARQKNTLTGIEVCRAMAARAADRLAALVDSRSHRIAFEASRLVLAYAWGAPRQTLEMVGDFGDLSRELAAALAEARVRRAGLDAAVPAGALALPAAGGAPIEAHVVEAAQVPTMNTYPTSEPAVSEASASPLQEEPGGAIAADDVEAGHENASATGAQDAAAPGTVAPDPEGGFLS